MFDIPSPCLLYFSPLIYTLPNLKIDCFSWGVAKLVRHQILVLACVGSNPAAPAILIRLGRKYVCNK